MTILSRLMARLYKLPPAETYDIAVDKNLEAPMPDGVILRADRNQASPSITTGAAIATCCAASLKRFSVCAVWSPIICTAAPATHRIAGRIKMVWS